MIRQSVLSLQDVLVLVTTSAGDPTLDTVQLAFTLNGANPGSGAWQDAAWVSVANLPVDTYCAQCLVGPGGTIALTVGNYTIWVKVTSNPEIPVLAAGTLAIY